MAPKKSNFRYRLEYAALRTVCALVNAIPYRLACALATGTANLAVTCGFKKARTLERIQSCFPEKTRAEAIALAKQSHQWQKDNGDFIPLPATWLNQERWEDSGVSEALDEPTDEDRNQKLTSFADNLLDERS